MIYITFLSIHHGIEFEKKFKKLISFKIIPTPRKISNSCGIVAKFNEKRLRSKNLSIEKDLPIKHCF